MLIPTQVLYGCSIESPAESIGMVRDLMFHDQSWVVRHLLVETGSWPSPRRVLLSPDAVQQQDWENQRLVVSLSADELRGKPPVDAHLPVSRQKAAEKAGPGAMGAHWTNETEPPVEPEEHPRLRSGQEVRGYQIAAADGEIGSVDDLIFDDEPEPSRRWRIRYLVVDTRKWLPGKKVLLAPLWCESITWEHRDVRVALTRQQIENSPEFDHAAPVGREYEARLYNHYGLPGYWVAKPSWSGD